MTNKKEHRLIWSNSIDAQLILLICIVLGIVLIALILSQRETTVSCQKIPDKEGALCSIEKNFYLIPNKTDIKHIYSIEASSIRDGEATCTVDLKANNRVDTRYFGTRDFQHVWWCKLNTEGQRLSDYLAHGTGDAVFKSRQISLIELIIFFSMFGVGCAIAHHYRDRILAIHIHPKTRIIRIFRIADAKRGFYRSYKFSSFYAFELGTKPDENGKEQLTITYHSRYETGDITPIVSDKEVHELYRYLNWVVLGR